MTISQLLKTYQNDITFHNFKLIYAYKSAGNYSKYDFYMYPDCLLEIYYKECKKNAPAFFDHIYKYFGTKEHDSTLLNLIFFYNGGQKYLEDSLALNLKLYDSRYKK